MQARVAIGEAATRLDEEGQSFHERVREGFSAIHAAQPERVRCVNASAGVETVQQQIRQLLTELIG